MEYLHLIFYSLLIVLGAFLVSWATESAQVLISQGLSLAILAWVQLLPEFIVEATLSYAASKNPANIKFVAANFTGSIRLLGGVGIPLIFFVRAFFIQHYTKIFHYKLTLPRLHGISVLGNFVPTIIFIIVIIKKNLSLIDSFILIVVYVVYLMFIKKTPTATAEHRDEMDFIPRKISGFTSFTLQWVAIIVLFVSGAIIFYLFVPYFVETCKITAMKLGVSAFIFIQWIAPFLTEFPEKLTIFYWAKNDKKAPIGLLNLLNANISQWTLLPAIIPIIYFLGSGKTSIIFADKHILEITLTMAQTIFLTSLLLGRRLSFWEAILIFILWFIQFLSPVFGKKTIEDFVREVMIYIYLGLSFMKIIVLELKRHRTSIIIDFMILIKRKN